MNKKYLCLFFTMIFIMTLFNCVNAQIMQYTNPDTNYQVIIEDDAELLTEADMDNLMTDMMPLTDFGNIAFKSIDNNATSTASYARDYYHGKFSTTSGSLFLIDMDNRQIYIFSDGNNYKIITSGKAEIITDNVYRYATNKDYYSCASNAYEQILALLNGFKIAEPMRNISNILVALVCGFIMSFIIVMINSKIKDASSNEIVKNCDVIFNVKSITGVKVGTHRVYSPQSSSSGGSSGGGYSGGGGSSGGGGGHSF